MIEETKLIAYRRAFLLTLVVLILVIGGAGWMWWNSPSNPMRRVQGSNLSQTPAETQIADSAASSSDTPLAPIQLSPQQIQSIGVKIGKVESKTLNDGIRSYGNVQPSERRFAYVQTRFAGWIRQVYANATGDFIRKG